MPTHKGISSAKPLNDFILSKLSCIDRNFDNLYSYSMIKFRPVRGLEVKNIILIGTMEKQIWGRMPIYMKNFFVEKWNIIEDLTLQFEEKMSKSYFTC